MRSGSSHAIGLACAAARSGPARLLGQDTRWPASAPVGVGGRAARPSAKVARRSQSVVKGTQAPRDPAGHLVVLADGHRDARHGRCQIAQRVLHVLERTSELGHPLRVSGAATYRRRAPHQGFGSPRQAIGPHERSLSRRARLCTSPHGVWWTLGHAVIVRDFRCSHHGQRSPSPPARMLRALAPPTAGRRAARRVG